MPADSKRDAKERATHNRLVLALDDLEEARSYALHLVTRRSDDHVVTDALNAAMIVA